MINYSINGFYMRGGWPMQIELQVVGTLVEAVEWCKGYGKGGNLGGYDDLTVSTNYGSTVEGWFTLADGWEINKGTNL